MSCIVGALSALGPVFTFEYVRRWESYETEDCECHPPPPPPPFLVLPARSIAHLRILSDWLAIEGAGRDAEVRDRLTNWGLSVRPLLFVARRFSAFSICVLVG